MKAFVTLLALSAITCAPAMANTSGNQTSTSGNNYHNDSSYAELDDQIHNGTGDINNTRTSTTTTNTTDSSNSGNATSSTTTNLDPTNTTSSTASNGNNSNTGGDITINDKVTNTNVRVPDVAVAPLPAAGKAGMIGDIAVPLPTISVGGFASGGDYDANFRSLDGGHTRQNYGVTLGFHVPLGTGDWKGYAAAEAKRRADRANFVLIKEAIVLKDAGVLSKDVHTAH